jgi:hypothetical protein
VNEFAGALLGHVGRTARVVLMRPRTLPSSRERASVSVISSRAPRGPQPALLTRASRVTGRIFVAVRNPDDLKTADKASRLGVLLGGVERGRERGQRRAELVGQ